MKVRKLTAAGIIEFTAFINSLRDGVNQNIPTYLLESDSGSEAISLDIDVSAQDFASRYEMGVYLVSLFKAEDIYSYLGDVGFWSWFALLWFDQLCPQKKDGRRKPSKDYNYVLSKNYNHRPRHAIYMTWQLVQRYDRDAMFMLFKEPSTRGEVTEQMMGRQVFFSSDGVMRLASQLYFDKQAGKIKAGVTSRVREGTIFRYISLLQQLELTFDIFSITKDELESLLPQEFNRYQLSNEGVEAS